MGMRVENFYGSQPTAPAANRRHMAPLNRCGYDATPIHSSICFRFTVYIYIYIFNTFPGLRPIDLLAKKFEESVWIMHLGFRKPLECLASSSSPSTISATFMVIYLIN